MAKKIIFIILGFSVLVVLGFWYKRMLDTDAIITNTLTIPETKLISQINTGTAMIGEQSTGIVATGLTISGSIENAIDDSKLPFCEDKLNPINVIDIDNVVTNCTEKKKEGREITELGGASTDFWIYNGQPTVPEQWQGKTYKPLCYSIDNDSKEKYSMYTVPEKNEEGTITIQGYSTLQHILNKGILSAVVYEMYPDRIFCGSNPNNKEEIDSDCTDMKESEAWTDGKNYFISGYRGTGRNERLYVINDKIYSPGKSSINNHKQNETGQGRWQFITVRDNKIIVKKMKDEKHYPWKDNESSINPSIYTLQTCEIQL